MSRMRYIATQTEQPIRFVGLSTALANAADLAAWLGIGPQVCLCWRRELQQQQPCGQCRQGPCAPRAGPVQFQAQRAAGPAGVPHPGLSGQVLLPAHGHHEQACLRCDPGPRSCALPWDPAGPRSHHGAEPGAPCSCMRR